MRLKPEHKVIALAVLGGAFLWLCDAIFDKVHKFPHEPFMQILIYDAPTHEFWMRPIFFLTFTLFGILIGTYLKKMRQSEGRYHYLFDNINDIILVRPFAAQNEEVKFSDANPVATQKLGYTRDELLQLSPRDLVDPKMLPEFSLSAETLRLGGHLLFETALVTKDGKTVPMEVNALTIDFHGKPSVLCIIRDISKRKNDEVEIRRLASFPQLNPNPILEVDTSGAITFANQACQETIKKLGEAPEAFLPEDLDKILQVAVQQGETQFQREIEIKGAWFSEFIYFTPQFNVARIFPVEITARRQAKEYLRESERQLRILTARLLEVQEHERSRITRELHDELGQSLMLMKLQVSTIRDHLRKDQGKLRRECSQALTSVDALIENIRRLIRDLSPTVLEELGLTSALKLLLEEFTKHYNISLGSVDFDDIDQLFPSAVQLGIYRIFQESLTNIGKHAKATSVSSIIKKQGTQVYFSIQDDGQGFLPEDFRARKNATGGIGLATMMERARLAGGHLDIKSRKGTGTEISFFIPIESAGEKEHVFLSNRLGG